MHDIPDPTIIPLGSRKLRLVALFYAYYVPMYVYIQVIRVKRIKTVADAFINFCALTPYKRVYGSVVNKFEFFNFIKNIILLAMNVHQLRYLTFYKLLYE